MKHKRKLTSVQKLLASQPPQNSYYHSVPVRYAACQQMAFYVVGVGGTGSWLAPHVARKAYFLQKAGMPCRVVLVDPDVVEEKNIIRQNFCEAEIGCSKAESMARRLSAAFSLKIDAINTPFEPALIGSGMGYRTMSILLGCVDNYKARRAMAKALDMQTQYLDSAREAHRVPQNPLLWWIDSGNGEDAGQVVIGNTNHARHLPYAFPAHRADQITTCTLLPSLALQHPDLLEEPEPPPVQLTPAPATALSCADMALAEVQAESINPEMANAVYSMLSQFLKGSLRVYATYYNVPTMSQIAKYITPENLGYVIHEPASFFKVFPPDEEAARPAGPAPDPAAAVEDEDDDEEVLVYPDEETEAEPEFEYA